MYSAPRFNGSRGGFDASSLDRFGRFAVWAHARGRRVGAGRAPERAREIRFLCAVALMVALVLRAGRRSQKRPAAVRRAAVFVRGAWPLAAIREGLSGILHPAG